MCRSGSAGGPAKVRVRLFVTGIALNRSESRRDGGFKSSWSFSLPGDWSGGLTSVCCF
uniref:Uncharacterized protein n=1 Tax=Xiphophorus couchianus TaxID=32473 RepID=A0A3B5KSD0_9TELE